MASITSGLYSAYLKVARRLVRRPPSLMTHIHFISINERNADWKNRLAPF
ncbi:MAG: hypothetical protein ACJAYF_000302 [Arenicella sp.]|jgi:hypothetical protein